MDNVPGGSSGLGDADDFGQIFHQFASEEALLAQQPQHSGGRPSHRKSLRIDHNMGPPAPAHGLPPASVELSAYASLAARLEQSKRGEEDRAWGVGRGGSMNTRSSAPAPASQQQQQHPQQASGLRSSYVSRPPSSLLAGGILKPALPLPTFGESPYL